MSVSAARRVGVGLAAVAVLVGLAGCDGDGDGDSGVKKRKKADAPHSAVQSQDKITEIIQAAFRKTSEAKSAKVRMTVSTPPGVQGGGTMEVTGVQGWDPAVMDLTVKGSALAAVGGPDAPSEMRMIMIHDAMYVDVGAAQAAQLEGKRWMKLDFEAAAEASGNEALQKQVSGSLGNLNQDPSEQLALLLQSPHLKHVGAEKVDGAAADHYKGTLTFEEMVQANQSADLLSAEQREALIADVKKAGIKGYDTEIWVNEDRYPVKMVLGMKMSQGTVRMTARYSDYGTAAGVEAPPAKDTVDLFAMLKDINTAAG
ncbi:hypothetical protein [Actinacidiphila sp. bgisy167]|uniref:hypothetical protein n=1 Tax=Actinacidiphila sp. bgisy167 TaxID=3413797 RepID=UPI003D73C6C1